MPSSGLCEHCMQKNHAYKKGVDLYTWVNSKVKGSELGRVLTVVIPIRILV